MSHSYIAVMLSSHSAMLSDPQFNVLVEPVGPYLETILGGRVVIVGLRSVSVDLFMTIHIAISEEM